MRYGIYKNNQIQKIINVGEPFTFDGIQYPSNWLELTTLQEKAARNIFPVYETSLKNENYYNFTGQSIQWSNSNSTIIIVNTYTEKNLNPIKNKLIRESKKNSRIILNDTDWFFIRNVEANTNIPQNIKDYRRDVKQTQNDYETSINSANTIEEVISININWPNREDYNIND